MCEGCEERIHVGHQVHRIDRSISKLLEMRVKEEGLDEIALMHGWILRYLYEHQDKEIYQKDIEKAYKSWYKVLRKGGKMINFDANWYLHLFDEEKRREYESDRKNVELSGMEDHYTCTDIDSMEDLARQVPLSKIQRPSWDRVVLDKIGFKNIKIDQNIWTKTWNEEEKLNYGSTPMFMIIGEK